MIYAERCHYDDRPNNDYGLEKRLNEIHNKPNTSILFVTSEYYGNGEVGYTIIYETIEYNWYMTDDEITDAYRDLTIKEENKNVIV